MKNQYSFRLTTTVLPTDLWSSHPAKTTQVINKVDANGNKFYPNFNEETVVITNDDRTIMETVRATCNDWVLTFVKRGLSDDSSETPIDNRKLTWNPWSLCFITAWAWDYIDPDDDRTWQWDQTYLWKATYKWRLITEKWVEYPHFDTLADLQDYWTPFGWMFAVVDASWELYRYNDVTESWDVITTNEPTNPEQADDETIGTVRVATDEEFEAGTDTWSHGEYLMATIPQIQWMTPEVDTKVFNLNDTTDLTTWQAIFDYCKAGKVALVFRSSSAQVKVYMYWQDVIWQRLRLFHINFSYSWWEWSPVTDISRDTISIYYSWNTVTSITFSS